jgi:hypothetical protein
VLGENGNLLAISDISGSINVDDLKPIQNSYKLVYENYFIGELLDSALNKKAIDLNDRIFEIEPLEIKKSKEKYLQLQGYFTSYVIVNGKLNSYGDGMVTFVFNNLNNKYVSENVLQYRSFVSSGTNRENKILSDNNFSYMLNTVGMEGLENIEALKNDKKYEYKETTSSNKEVVELKFTKFGDKEKKFLGHRITDMSSYSFVSYLKNQKKTIKTLSEVFEEFNIKLKHKTEEDYNKIVVYNHFYPTEISFSNEKNVAKVRYISSFTNFKDKYWEDDEFPKNPILKQLEGTLYYQTTNVH